MKKPIVQYSPRYENVNLLVQIKVLQVFGQRTSAPREDYTMLNVKCMYVLCTNNLFCMINATRSFTEIYTSMFD